MENQKNSYTIKDRFEKANLSKQWIAISLVVFVLLVAGAWLYFSGRERTQETEKNPVFSAIEQGELVGTGEVGSKIMMGDLEITLHDVIEDSYRPLELDEQGNRITKQFLAAQVTIFHTGYGEKEFLIFGLADERGGQYLRDRDVEFYVDDMKDFGPAREIYPRTIREGYLFFEAPEPTAQELQLMVLSETTNKKVIFSIQR